MRSNLESLVLSECRICHSKNLRCYLNLGKMPLANSYLSEAQLNESEFTEELAVLFCEKCFHSQLSRIVAPDRMFKHYLYISSTTTTFNHHCEQLAIDSSKRLNFFQGCLVLDIASNDGCLLSRFQQKGCRVVGVDPAENLSKEANRKGIPTINAYWSPEVAEKVRQEYGIPLIITGTNIIAHVHDVHQFVQAVSMLLPQEGIFVIECPYLIDFIEQNEFDTIYHEHLSYFGFHAMKHLVEQHELEIFDHDFFPNIHGGTVRFYIGHQNQRPVSGKVSDALRRETEKGFTRFQVYTEFATRVNQNKTKLMELLRDLKQRGKVIWGYGASAKGNTLMGFFGIARDLVDVIIDDNPKKWCLFTPGSHIRITSIKELSHEVDYLLLLAWNFSREIRERCQRAGYTGQFILPVPKPVIVE